MPFILPLEPCQCLIPSLHIFLGSFSTAFVLDTGLTREVVVGEICHVACIDGESPKYLSIFGDRSVTPCHTHHSHVGVFCFSAWELCLNGMPETNSNNCWGACGNRRWAEMGPRWGGGRGCGTGSGYLVRCSWRSASPSRSVNVRSSSPAPAAFCCSRSTCCLLPLSSSVSLSISLGRQAGRKHPIRHRRWTAKLPRFGFCHEFNVIRNY